VQGQVTIDESHHLRIRLLFAQDAALWFSNYAICLVFDRPTISLHGGPSSSKWRLALEVLFVFVSFRSSVLYGHMPPFAAALALRRSN